MMIKLPAIALRGMTILPGMIAHFDISREKSLKAVEVSMNENQQIYLVTQKDVESDNPGLDELYQVGIIAEIKQVIKMQNNIVRVLAEGKCRAGIFSFTEKKEYLEAEIEILEDTKEEWTEEEKIAMRRSIRDAFNQYVKVHGKIAPEAIKQANSYDSVEKLIKYVSNMIPVGYADKQRMLEADSLSERYEVLLAILLREIDVMAVQKEFQEKVKKRIDNKSVF
jgi:ATP-dependent Lon protease